MCAVQINYVLATRFNLDKGYIIESKKGGGGYIRVIRIDIDENMLLDLVTQRIGNELSQKDAMNIIERLKEIDVVTPKEAALMKSAVADETYLIPLAVKDRLRANILRSMIIAILKEEG